MQRQQHSIQSALKEGCTARRKEANNVLPDMYVWCWKMTSHRGSGGQRIFYLRGIGQ